ncbi:MAG: tetratricopeptide repeat protein [Chitinivibrionales bacterium]|nr:tetratricopeptide repeat protein [Chitinivibrionales bacterium]MBD3357384.1 tetratricopeptide repeat protein [Chitinivibrionales bacterium]
MYLWKTIWPFGLSVLYPLRFEVPWWETVPAAGILVTISAFVLLRASKHPYAFMGWLWYLGTLVPVIGIVQFGSHSMADRYTYIPHIGLFIAICWTARSVFDRLAWGRTMLQLATILPLFLYSVRTWHHLPAWRDGESLFSQAVAVTKSNFIAHNNLAAALVQKGKLREAQKQLQTVIRIRPEYDRGWLNLIRVLIRQGRSDEASLVCSQGKVHFPNHPTISRLCDMIAPPKMRTTVIAPSNSQ